MLKSCSKVIFIVIADSFRDRAVDVEPAQPAASSCSSKDGAFQQSSCRPIRTGRRLHGLRPAWIFDLHALQDYQVIRCRQRWTASHYTLCCDCICIL
ncbi:hypothetical protein CDAR_288171 [Caerostris darwini]|uniref:Uncharacterized protein n=1 Tax=Caerostris darwini TaxID=1538125 RepID=A0AAV4WBH5_9ARAC|nr:hypothetical protein CDAR_288171 [Caerostris darwini]